MLAIAALALMVIAYATFSRRLTSWYVSAPIAFTVVGALLAWAHPPVVPESDLILTVAEVTLALILFQDAAQVHPRELMRERGVLARLLLVGLPLTIALGWGAAHLLFPGAGVWLALFVAAALAPTDAGLGAATVLNPIVPERVRRILNGESGLNDGLATPVVLFALTALGTSGESGLRLGPSALEALVELVVGAAIGIGAGAVGGRVLGVARERGWAAPALLPVGIAAIPLLAYFGASLLHGNGFIAAFVAGTAFAAARSADEEEPLVVTESLSTLLGYAVWGLFGALFVSQLGHYLSWEGVAFALLALSALRMLPVWLVLTGTGLATPSKAFIAWFGPRGLATVVFALIAIADFGLTGDDTRVAGAIGITVLLSVVAHGLSAPPWSAAYGRWVERVRPPAELEA